MCLVAPESAKNAKMLLGSNFDDEKKRVVCSSFFLVVSSVSCIRIAMFFVALIFSVAYNLAVIASRTDVLISTILSSCLLVHKASSNAPSASTITAATKSSP